MYYTPNGFICQYFTPIMSILPVHRIKNHKINIKSKKALPDKIIASRTAQPGK